MGNMIQSDLTILLLDYSILTPPNHFMLRFETEMWKGEYSTAFMNSYYVKTYWPQVTEIMQAHLEFCTLDPVWSERDLIFLHNYSEKTMTQ